MTPVNVPPAEVPLPRINLTGTVTMIEVGEQKKSGEKGARGVHNKIMQFLWSIMFLLIFLLFLAFVSFF